MYIEELLVPDLGHDQRVQLLQGEFAAKIKTREELVSFWREVIALGNKFEQQGGWEQADKVLMSLLSVEFPWTEGKTFGQVEFPRLSGNDFRLKGFYHSLDSGFVVHGLDELEFIEALLALSWGGQSLSMISRYDQTIWIYFLSPDVRVRAAVGDFYGRNPSLRGRDRLLRFVSEYWDGYIGHAETMMDIHPGTEIRVNEHIVAWNERNDEREDGSVSLVKREKSSLGTRLYRNKQDRWATDHGGKNSPECDCTEDAPQYLLCSGRWNALKSLWLSKVYQLRSADEVDQQLEKFAENDPCAAMRAHALLRLGRFAYSPAKKRAIEKAELKERLRISIEEKKSRS